MKRREKRLEAAAVNGTIIPMLIRRPVPRLRCEVWCRQVNGAAVPVVDARGEYLPVTRRGDHGYQAALDALSEKNNHAIST